MTEAEELELLELEEEAAKAGPQAPAAAAPVPAAPPRVGMGETILNKAVDALPLGRLSTNLPATLALQAAKLFGPDWARRGIPGPIDTYRGVRDEATERGAAGAQQNPISAGAGAGLGTALSLLAPIPKATVGSGAGGRILSSALTAGGYGALNSGLGSQGDLTRGDVGQVLGDALGVGGLKQAYQDAKEGRYGRALLDSAGAGGLGGLATGGALGGAMEGVQASGIIPKVSGWLDSFANRKALNALGAMKPELNRLGSKEANALGQYALDKGVVSPLASRATMAQRIADLRKAAGGQISGALGELDAAALPGERINSLQAAQDVEGLAADLARKPALATTANKFRNEADLIRNTPGAGPQTLEAFEENIARPYKQTTNWNTDLALPKETLKRLPMALEAQVEKVAGNISRRTGSDALERYMAGKSDYGNLVELRDIAEEGLKRQASNHSLGLKDVMAALGGAAMGGAHSPTSGLAMGAAGLVGGKLASRFGDQLSATGARGLSSFLPTVPGRSAASLESLLEALRQPQRLGTAPGPDADAQLQLAAALRGGP